MRDWLTIQGQATTSATTRSCRTVCLGIVLAVVAGNASHADSLDDVRSRGRLIWGADREGGGPFVYGDPKDPTRAVGFEVELADLIAHELNVTAQFFQGPWDSLPSVLQTRQIDIVLNGYELMPNRMAQMAYSQPYYVYQLALLGRVGDTRLARWADLKSRSGADRARIGVLGSTAAERYLAESWLDHVEIVKYDSTTDAMEDVGIGRIDATLTDQPVATFYRDRYRNLRTVGDPVGRGFWVIYLRKEDTRLRDAINAALRIAIQSGKLRAIYERYGIWTPAQDELLALVEGGDAALGVSAQAERGWTVMRNRGPLLLQAALMTVFLSVTSMPLAIALGLLVAVGRLYGPALVRWPLTMYVELLRGTPLMLQLYVIYFLLPTIGIRVPALVAAIAGLAVNYSAYESEIYRAGIQAIPRGQMEAALALGMSRALALRRIIIPQAVRIVIPPVTNDFIALFKDTSVCSVITIAELTKQYSIEKGNTGAVVELAALTALLYMLMSVPLSHFANWMEQRLGKRKLAA